MMLDFNFEDNRERWLIIGSFVFAVIGIFLWLANKLGEPSALGDWSKLFVLASLTFQAIHLGLYRLR